MPLLPDPPPVFVLESVPITIQPPTAFPSAILSGQTWTSGIFSMSVFNRLWGAMQGYNNVNASFGSTQNLTVSTQFYLDQFGNSPVSSAGPYAQVSAMNSSGVTAIISNPMIVLSKS